MPSKSDPAWLCLELGMDALESSATSISSGCRQQELLAEVPRSVPHALTQSERHVSTFYTRGRGGDTERGLLLYNSAVVSERTKTSLGNQNIWSWEPTTLSSWLILRISNTSSLGGIFCKGKRTRNNLQAGSSRG